MVQISDQTHRSTEEPSGIQRKIRGTSKESCGFNQELYAAEIRSASEHTCHLNQSAISRMLKGEYMPKEGERAVRSWVTNEKRKKYIQETGEVPIETIILDELIDNEKCV